MAEANNINFMAMLNPQFAAQQQKFALQQQMAAEMMKEGDEQPSNNQLANPGGMVVQNSPWAALTRAIEKGVGAYSANKAIGDQMAVYQNMNGQQTSVQSPTGQSGAPLLPWQNNAETGQQQGTPSSQQVGNMLGASNDPNDPINDKTGLLDPIEMIKAHFAYKAKPDAYKVALAAAGGDPIKASQILMAKATADADVEHRQGSTYQNTLTGAAGMTPKIPEGATGNFGPNGNINSVAPLPIVAPGQQPSLPTPQAAVSNPVITPQSAAGTAVLNDMYGTPAPASLGANSSPVSPQGNGGPVVLNGSSQGQPSPLPGDFPKPAAPSQMTITPGDTTAANKNATDTQQRNSDILTQAGSSPTRISDLQKIYNLAQTPTNFGPGAGKKTYWEAISKQIPGVDPDLTDAANYEVARKYFNNLTGQYQKSLGGTGTDKQLDVAQGGTPGPDMLNAAITKVAPFLMGQEKALQAQAGLRRAITDPANNYGSNTTQNLQNLEGYWQKNYDPDAFELASIPDAKKPDFIKSLSPDDAKKLITSYGKAQGNGWIQ